MHFNLIFDEFEPKISELLKNFDFFFEKIQNFTKGGPLLHSHFLEILKSHFPRLLILDWAKKWPKMFLSVYSNHTRSRFAPILV